MDRDTEMHKAKAPDSKSQQLPRRNLKLSHHNSSRKGYRTKHDTQLVSTKLQLIEAIKNFPVIWKHFGTENGTDTGPTRAQAWVIISKQVNLPGGLQNIKENQNKYIQID